MNKCLGNIEILYQTVWGVQWVGPRQNYTRKEPQLNTSLGKAVRKKLCKEQLIKHPPPTPNPKLLPNPIAFTLPSRHLPSYAIASAVPHPDCRCQRQLHLENLNGSPLLSGSPDVGWCREFFMSSGPVLPLVEAVFDANMIFWWCLRSLLRTDRRLQLGKNMQKLEIL